MSAWWQTKCIGWDRKRHNYIRVGRRIFGLAPQQMAIWLQQLLILGLCYDMNIDLPKN